MSLRQTTIHKQIELSCTEMMNTADHSGYILAKAKRLYENRCMDLMFIVEVVQLLWESEIGIMSWNQSGHGTVYVDLLVSYKLFNRGDIIAGCRVDTVEPSATLICSAPGATIRVAVKKQVYKVGSYIPVVVRGSEYTLFQSTVSVLATDFRLDPIRTAEYEIAAKSDKEVSFLELDTLDELAKKLCAEKKTLASKIMDLFPEPATQLKPAGSIRKFKAKLGDIVQVRALLPRDDSYYSVGGETKDYPVLPENEVHIALLQAYCSTLRKFLTLLEYYDDETFAADQYIWSLARPPK